MQGMVQGTSNLASKADSNVEQELATPQLQE